MMFSLLMCTYNSSATLERAMKSCHDQSFSDWELCILDNGSVDDSVKIIENYAREDNRVHLISRADNVGWAKGISLLLEKTSGEYMCFLAADDYFCDAYALEKVSCVIAKEDKPDIVFVKHETVNDADGMVWYDDEPLSYMCVKSDNRIHQLTYAVENIYYNSMFHFERIDYLKETGVDFFDPYYGDNAGMTKCILDTSAYSVISNPIYALTSDTSKTRGRVIWGEPFGLQRWRLVEKAIIKHGIYDNSELQVIAKRFLRLDYNILSMLCSGAETRDVFMNPRSDSNVDRLGLCAMVLSDESFALMNAYVGDLEEKTRFVSLAMNMCESIDKKDFSGDESGLWLWSLLRGLRGSSKGIDDIKLVYEGIINSDNKGCFGFELLGDLLDCMSDNMINDVVISYCASRIAVIEKLIDLRNRISECRMLRMSEKQAISSTCYRLIGIIKPYLPEDSVDEVISIVEDES